MTDPRHGHLLAGLPPPGADESLETLLCRPGLRIERIVSHGHSSAPGFWYDQPDDEWVMVVAGRATLAFENGRELALGPGEWVMLPARCRHRVVATADPTVWLAVFAGGD